MVACNERIEEAGTAIDGDKVGVNFSVIIPKLPQANTSTRVMTENPNLKNLYLAVFDKEGYLLDYVKATVEADQLVNNIEYAYSVKLPSTSDKTIVHFIGNAPEFVRFGTETEVIATMTTSGTEDAYWQRVELEHGTKGADLTQKMNNVQLIRNFAWIQLTEETNKFTLDSYCVLNKRTMGSVAPYNAQARLFADYGENVNLDSLRKIQRYDAFIPTEAEQDMDIPAEEMWTKVGNDGKETNLCFVYERETPRTSPMVILMKGTYDGNANRFYKIDLRDGSGQYFPILRNFKYTMTVTQIDHSGYASAQEAADGAGSGDVSQSIETESFNNISDGTVRMFVSYTDKTLVNDDKDVTLKYKFIYFVLNNSEQNYNDSVTVSKEAFLAGGDVIEGYQVDKSDDSKGWRTITITPTVVGNLPKIQSLLVEGKVTVGNKTYSLQRRVRFTLRQKMEMSLQCDPQAIKGNVGEPFDLVLKVPGGLGEALFPLDFELEAAKQSITPDKGDDLPVVTGNSIIEGQESKITIGFIKSLSWQEYEAAANVGGIKSIFCHFKSSKAESATRIYAKNEYFQLAFTDLGNYTPKEFSNLRFSESSVPFGRGQRIDFSFDVQGPQMPAQGVKVTLDGLEPAPEEIRMTYVGVVDGKAQYYFSQGLKTTGNTLQLVTLYDDQPVSVKLEAFQYNVASASLDFNYEEFSNLRFEPSKINGNAAGVSVTFRFNMSKTPDNVIVSLNGLAPATDETRLTLISGNRYSYAPSANATSGTLKLVTTNGIAGEEPMVTLEALGFTTASAKATFVLYIPKGNIKVGNGVPNSNTTFTLYSSNPGDSYNAQSFASFKAEKNGANTSDIEINYTVYQQIKNDTIYVRYYTSSGFLGWDRTYYVAIVKLSDLINGTAGNLNFVEQ